MRTQPGPIVRSATMTLGSSSASLQSAARSAVAPPPELPPLPEAELPGPELPLPAPPGGVESVPAFPAIPSAVSGFSGITSFVARESSAQPNRAAAANDAIRREEIRWIMQRPGSPDNRIRRASARPVRWLAFRGDEDWRQMVVLLP